MVTKQERRKHTRYQTKTGAYATISPESAKLGQIVDISFSGLAFKYVDTKRNELKNNAIIPETIFLSSIGYYVGDIDFKTVEDFEITDPEFEQPLPEEIKTRVRRVEFIDLKLKQLFDLDNYIEQNAL